MLPLLKKSGLKLAMETIDFQPDTFGQDIEVIVTKLQSKIVSKEYNSSTLIKKSPEVASLVTLIEERLGMRVNFIVDNMVAAIMPFYSNKNHIFLNDVFRGNFTIKDQEKILNKAKDKAGFVNSHKAKLGGVFAEYTNQVYMNFEQLFNMYKASPGEVAAILLHELGHGFYVCEYADRLESTNQVLANVAQEISGKKEKKDMIYIYRELGKINPKVTEEEVDKLVNGNRTIASATWFKVVIGAVTAQQNNAKYDQSSFEQLADNFAARFKYGRQLVTGLEKIHGPIATMHKSKTWLTICAMGQLLHTLTSIISAVMCLYFGMFALGFICAIVSFVVFMSNSDEHKDMTYDELKIRYKRVRNEYVDLLKDIDLPKEQVSNVLADVYLMDKMIQETHRYTNLITPFSNFIFTSGKDAGNAIAEQQMLETLAFSDLFVKSAELRTIA